MKFFLTVFVLVCFVFLFGCLSPKPLTQEQIAQISESLLNEKIESKPSVAKQERPIPQKATSVAIVKQEHKKVQETKTESTKKKTFFDFVEKNISWLTFILYILCQWIYWLYRYKVGKKSETFEQIIETLGKKLSWTKKTMFYFLKRWFLKKQEEKNQEGEKK